MIDTDTAFTELGEPDLSEPAKEAKPRRPHRRTRFPDAMTPDAQTVQDFEPAVMPDPAEFPEEYNVPSMVMAIATSRKGDRINRKRFEIDKYTQHHADEILAMRLTGGGTARCQESIAAKEAGFAGWLAEQNAWVRRIETATPLALCRELVPEAGL